MQLATPTRHQLYGHLPPITKTIQVRRTRHAGHCWRSRDELLNDELLWTGQNQDDQHKHTSSNYVRIQGVALKTCRRRWTIERIGERGSGISVPMAQHDDDDDDSCLHFYVISFRDCFFFSFWHTVPLNTRCGSKNLQHFLVWLV